LRQVSGTDWASAKSAVIYSANRFVIELSHPMRMFGVCPKSNCIIDSLTVMLQTKSCKICVIKKGIYFFLLVKTNIELLLHVQCGNAKFMTLIHIKRKV